MIYTNTIVISVRQISRGILRGKIITIINGDGLVATTSVLSFMSVFRYSVVLLLVSASLKKTRYLHDTPLPPTVLFFRHARRVAVCIYLFFFFFYLTKEQNRVLPSLVCFRHASMFSGLFRFVHILKASGEKRG